MTKKLNLDSYMKKLEKVRKEVIEEIVELEPKVEQNILESGEEANAFPTHIADIADIESRLDRDSYLINQYTKELRDIDVALRKIVEKTFGICEDCNDQIRKERLDAIPYTRYCKKCAENREKVAWRKKEE